MRPIGLILLLLLTSCKEPNTNSWDMAAVLSSDRIGHRELTLNSSNNGSRTVESVIVRACS